jgi:hypothetical protein
MPGKAQDFEKNTIEMKRLNAQIEASMASKSASEQASAIKQMGFIADAMAPVAREYDKHIANGRTPTQAQELVDTRYERAVESISGIGGDISGYSPAFERQKYDVMTNLKENAEIKYKEAQTGKVEAETKKIGRETEAGGSPTEKRGWHSNVKSVLGSLYGNLTDQGYVIDPARMKEYKKSLTLVDKYRKQGMDPNEAAVRASEEANKFGTLDALPEGSVQLGTQGGVALWQAPDGKVYRQE